MQKIVEVCISVIMHVMGDKLVITLFHKDYFYEISGNNNLSKLFSFLHFLIEWPNVFIHMFIKLQTSYFHVIRIIELPIIIFNNMICHVVLFFFLFFFY